MVCLSDPVLSHRFANMLDPGPCDQQVPFEWIHNLTAEFGGNPSDITLFGESTWATEILCLIHPAMNQKHHLFHCAILQSPSVEFNVPEVQSAGATLTRTLPGYNTNAVDDPEETWP